MAALLVCITHIRTPLFEDISHLKSSNVVLKTFYGVHGFGHVAVMVFFVLSGFLVGGEIVRSAVNGEFEWGSYLVRRAARIYPAFIAALALTAGLDFIGASYLDIHGIYSGHLTGPRMDPFGASRMNGGTMSCFLWRS